MSALLVVRPSSLGDIVHALSIVPDVVRARPGTTVDWVCEPAFGDLPALSPHVRSTWIVGADALPEGHERRRRREAALFA